MKQSCQEQCASHTPGRLVKLEDAVGLVLAHDITEIVYREQKGPAFKKGYQVKPEDIPHLARLGKRHLFVLDVGPGQLHEDQAAEIMANALRGSGVELAGPPSEGKIVFKAAHQGLFMLDPDRLTQFNMIPGMSCSTIHRYTPVKKGQELGGTRAIPLIIDREPVEQGAALASQDGGLLKVLPYQPLETGVVVTGNEVFDGLIEDRFAGIVSGKLKKLGASTCGVRLAPDDRQAVANAIKELMDEGAQLIITTAGMSVDPDDVTRLGISDAGGRDLTYGTPILPGAMFLAGVLDGPKGEIPILGVPACALFYQATVLDLILPRVLAGEVIDREKIAAMAHGGYCLNCPDGCRFPRCGFGRGS